MAFTTQVSHAWNGTRYCLHLVTCLGPDLSPFLIARLYIFGLTQSGSNRCTSILLFCNLNTKIKGIYFQNDESIFFKKKAFLKLDLLIFSKRKTPSESMSIFFFNILSLFQLYNWCQPLKKLLLILAFPSYSDMTSL